MGEGKEQTAHAVSRASSAPNLKMRTARPPGKRVPRMKWCTSVTRYERVRGEEVSRVREKVEQERHSKTGR